MAGIDETREFIPVGIAILTVSDSRSEADDESGGILAQRAKDAGHNVVARQVVRDHVDSIRQAVSGWIDDPEIDVVITTGGTGLTMRDVTPEAVAEVSTKKIPGFGELFRMLSYEEIGSSTIQSRAVGALCGPTLVFALPGSTGACKTAIEGILLKQLDARHKPCNFATLLPRMRGEDLSDSSSS